MPFYRPIIAYFMDYVKSEYLFERETRKVLRLGIFFVFVRADRIKLSADIRAKTSNPFDLLLSKLNTSNKTKIQRFLNNSYTHTGVGSCRAITSDVFRNEQANQSTVYPTSDCYLSVPGKDLFLFNTQIKVSEKLNIQSRETLFVQDP